MISTVWFHRSKYEKCEGRRWHSNTPWREMQTCHGNSSPSDFQDFDWSIQTEAITKLSKRWSKTTLQRAWLNDHCVVNRCPIRNVVFITDQNSLVTRSICCSLNIVSEFVFKHSWREQGSICDVTFKAIFCYLALTRCTFFLFFLTFVCIY